MENKFITSNPEELLLHLESETPLIESNYPYKSSMTIDEIRQHEAMISQLTIDILNNQAKAKELSDIIKSAGQERGQLAVTLESGEIERVADKAVKFYDAKDRTVSIYVNTENGYAFEKIREATFAEIEQWKRNQDTIRQTEIEAGAYRQSLYQIAGYNDSAQL